MVKTSAQKNPSSPAYVNDSLKKQVDALRDLIEVSKTVVSTLDLDTLLKSILMSAMQYAETPAGSVAIYDSTKQEFTLHAHCGLSAEFIKVERWTATPGSLTEQILKSGEMLIISNAEETPFPYKTVAVEEGVKSLICVPLICQKDIVGIIYLDDFVPREFDREKLDLLSILASFAALAVNNARFHNKTKLMAITDFLTGLYNHRYFQEIFKLELGRAQRYQKPLSLMIFDIDDFKRFNDRFGHAVGDKVLIAIGDIITRSLRKVDYAFRYGGEEFVLILPETPLESAAQAAERLREMIAVEADQSVPEAEGVRITVSAGVACYPENGNCGEDLFSFMDAYLYKAKSMGKNIVCYAAVQES